jgi:signal peptidase I
MLPTYQDGGVNLVNRLAYARSEPKRGDVVAIRLAGQSVMYLKRVVGLPGDTVAFHEGHLLIDGEVVKEPYLNPGCDWEIPPETLAPGLYYVVGDNRSMPEKLHEKGKTPRQRIVGRVLW